MKFINSIHPLLEAFDAFIVDLWGVLHDGQAAYEGAPEALLAMKQAGKRVVLLSNAPRRARRAVEVLGKLGYLETTYDTVLTSGEVLFRSLTTDRKHWPKNVPEGAGHFYYIGPEKDCDLLADAPEFQAVMSPAEAEFCVVTGYDGDHSIAEEKDTELQACITANLPMLCANPDRIVVRKNGHEMLCAGVIAERYRSMGGNVEWFGKPYPAVYQACREYLGMELPTDRICAIGDSLHTDIAGALKQRMHGVLVTGGILANQLDSAHGELPDRAKLQVLCDAENVAPDAVIPSLRY